MKFYQIGARRIYREKCYVTFKLIIISNRLFILIKFLNAVKIYLKTILIFVNEFKKIFIKF